MKNTNLIVAILSIILIFHISYASSYPSFDRGQTINITENLSAYTSYDNFNYSWLMDIPGSYSYQVASSSLCSIPSGTQATNGLYPTCRFVTNSLTQTGAYSVEFNFTRLCQTRVSDDDAFADSDDNCLNLVYGSSQSKDTYTSNSVPRTFIVNASPSVSISSANMTLEEGQSYSFNASVSGGVGPFIVNFIYSNGTVAKSYSGVTSGSFTFTASKSGTFIIHASATDQGTLHPYTVYSQNIKITVNSALSIGNPSVIVRSSNINVGQNETITANVSGGSAPLTYNWTENGNVVSESNSVAFAPSAPGTYIFNVTVTDALGHQVKGTVTITAYSAVSFGSPSLALKYTTLNVGQNETITANVSGGRSPYTFAWTVGGKSVPGNTNTITFNATVAGTNTITVTATDSDSQSASANTNIIVNSALSIGNPSVIVRSSNINVGQNETITANVSGGSAPLTYNWTENGNVVSESNSVAFAPSAPGTYIFNVTVTDALGHQVKGTVTITAYSAVSFGSPSLALKYTTLNVGQNETITANVSGGRSPYTFAWTVGGKSVPGNTNTITFNATVAGTNTITVTATDSDSQAKLLSANITVNADPSLGNPTVIAQSLSTDVGLNDTITANILGGTSPFAYQWTENGNAISEGESFVFRPNTTGNYTFGVVVTDSRGFKTTSGSVKIAVNNPPVAAIPLTSFNTSIAYIDQTQNATLIESNASSGSAPYTYNWIVILPGSNTTTKAAECQPILTCTFPTNELTLTGTYKFYIIITDSAGYSITKGPVTIAVYPALNLSAPGIDPADQGQTAHIYHTIPKGGVPPYSYVWFVEFPSSNTYAVANSICPSSSMGSNQVSGTNETCTFVTNSFTQTGTYHFKFQVTDRASKPKTVNSSATPLLVNVTPSASLSMSTNSLTVGNSDVITANLLHGTGPFTVNFTYSNGTVANTVTGVPYNGVATYDFVPSASGTFTFNAVVYDKGTTQLFIFNSTKLSTSVSPAPSSGGSGGGGGGGGGGSGGGGGGTFKPTVLEKTVSPGLYCSYISNFTQKETQKVILLNNTFTLVQNFITPSTAGVTVNNFAYELKLLKSNKLGSYNGINYSIELLNISYLPIMDTITVSMCASVPISTKPLTSTNRTNSTHVTPSQTSIVTAGTAYNGQASISKYKSLEIHVVGLNLSALVTSNSSSNVQEQINITKYAGGPLISGNTMLTGFNISVSPYPGISVTTDLGYECNVYGSGVSIYRLGASGWTPVTDYSINKNKCTITLPTNGLKTTIGVFVPSKATTTALVSANSAARYPSQLLAYIATALIIALMLIILLAKRRRKKEIVGIGVEQI